MIEDTERTQTLWGGTRTLENFSPKIEDWSQEFRSSLRCQGQAQVAGVA